MTVMRRETDSLGVVEVPAHKLWGRSPTRTRGLAAMGDPVHLGRLVKAATSSTW